MATKSRRAGTATPQPTPGGSSTPLNSGNRPLSPLSPTRHSRLQEKAELQNLNDRLACYIDRVRNLETENARLSIEVQTTRDTVTRESNSIKSMYEVELNDARRLLDETSREKAKLEIDTKRLWEENEELKARLDKKTKECVQNEGTSRMYESRANEVTNKLNVLNAERKKINDELAEAQKECDRLRKQLEDVRKHLESETLSRVDLENHIQSLREELAFKDQIHSQEINETRSRRQVEISEIDGRLSEQYEAKLQQSLQELRDQYEAQMRVNRDEIEKLYESKMKNMQEAAQRNTSAASSVIEELRSSRTRIDALNSRIGELESANAALHARVRDLENALDQERASHASEIANLEGELQRLRDEMALQLQEYQDLMDIKVSLDLEIAAYDKLLCGEESRLNITPVNSHSASSFSQSLRSSRGTPLRKTPSRGVSSLPHKRKRTAIDESDEISQSSYYVTGHTKGDIEISEVDPEGKFVKLHNKSSKEVAIGTWQLQRLAGTKKTVHKFHHLSKIDAGAEITVWSSDITGITHEPPFNIVMKGSKWLLGENMKTLLLNAEGVEVAVLERIKRSTTVRTARHRITGGLSSVTGNEDIYHGQSDPKQGEERCRLM